MKRVVVTGLGALSPLGTSLKETWENAVKGISGAQPISRFDTEKFKTKFACEIKGFDPTGVLDRNEIKRSDLFTQYALYVSTEALNDSGLDLEKVDPFDVGVIWGSGQGGMDTFEQEVGDFAKGDGTPRFSPFFIPKLISNMASGMISMKFGLMGINYTTVAACATANSAIMDAFNYIKLGKAKVFITGGSESPVTSASIGGFNAIKAMSTRNDEPTKASRPFDVNRDGFVMGEGAGAIVLEEYEHAKARGAKIYAEIVGSSMTADAYHMTATHPEGIGASRAMENALAEAGLSADKVDYMNAHATSTPVGDISEIKAINNTFGTSEKLHISSTKSMTGHLLGAAGAIESIFCIKAIQDGVIPPTINLEELDPEVPGHLKIVANEALETKVEVAMNNSFGFGGHNAIALFRKFN
ncbi:MAG: beta-ketoacyl-[acyl-carrier-protein] synthase II [Flammeovirgaceae bacterium]|nr:beta-ketoacyl-[acyl-carrier-protein] synthase II [Flammeovirgaceae bacterium]MBR06627.1 beta-ketoacyl-[acyl-carrier-protein] synthase II [Rickettsiales bacterium]HCX24099.1 beta-ketoacyl-[acyl-carrier-protein] synthase II [Cytophagales bacterium]